ncbi:MULTISPECIES: PA-phosphatase [unclassified Mycolicibacterium]|uniref:PA-phosphatase n=1 Tax=unclassified Mycolicibacterium TaxID=2636767 RepID=UPI00192E3B3E|nr:MULTISPECIES: PA-phosphatase [unclassified Mycolicibacterium]MUM06127.1 PA-phosphatase [Mycolicibacterium sp. CBMA 213]
MTVGQLFRWWPPVGLVLTVLLGIGVGTASTPLDDDFQRAGQDTWPYSGWLLFFTDPRTMFSMLVIAVGITLWRKRWRLAVAMALCPMAALLIERVVKPLFGRHKGGSLAYPSGHTTLMVTVVGMIVVAAGAVLWSRILAGIFVPLGMLGQAMTYHYFTDTVGALMFGSGVVCLAAWAAGVLPAGPKAADLGGDGNRFTAASG